MHIHTHTHTHTHTRICAPFANFESGFSIYKVSLEFYKEPPYSIFPCGKVPSSLAFLEISSSQNTKLG